MVMELIFIITSMIIHQVTPLMNILMNIYEVVDKAVYGESDSV